MFHRSLVDYDGSDSAFFFQDIQRSGEDWQHDDTTRPRCVPPDPNRYAHFLT
jgi:hypothetical protein